ncbi:MAG: 3',5'-cyclic-nucleotide phosphodiesterase [Burkholderiales bacterium]
MNLRVLGCSGSIAAGSRTTSFLLDGKVLIDAGSGVGDLTLDELTAIDHIVVSHSHLDHVLGIPLLADSVARHRLAATPYRPIQVHGLDATLEALRRHLFNDVLWPDFTRLPDRERPLLELVPFQTGQTLDLSGYCIEVLPAVHTVPAVGFAVNTPSGWWVFSGDTGPNPALWKALRGRRIVQVVIETAFSDEELPLAQASQHLSPSLLIAELAQLEPGVPVAITHIKPGEMSAVLGQIAALGVAHPIRALATGDRLSF